MDSILWLMNIDRRYLNLVGGKGSDRFNLTPPFGARRLGVSYEEKR